ncbi:MAG: phosphatidate cytidylyltransferase [Bacteroidaceae bacterium]|nr:phosphatidate cytidylyltransferase [Bacteroidaceae bacterium]
MKNFIIRAITGLTFAAVLIGSILYSPYSLIMLFSIVAALTIWEFGTIVNNHAGASINRMISAVAGFYLVFAVGWYQLGLISGREFTPYLLTLIYLLVSELYRQEPNPLKNWTYAFASQMYIALPFALLSVLGLHYDSFANKMQYDFIFPLSVFIFLWMSDTGAYLVGSLLSRYFPAKLFPRISPKKSWVGSIGGGLLCLAAAWCIYAYEPKYMELWQWMGLALTVCVFGTWGDLVESLLKRQVGIKDSGNILPGHGGLLDRFDSSLLAIPAALAYLMLVC